MARNNTTWEFANVKLTRDNKQAVRDYAKASDDNLLYVIERLGISGYKMSISRIDARNAWCCTLTGTDATPHNKGFSMTSWAPEPDEAIFIAGYKHEILCSGGRWKDFEEEQGEWG